MPIGVLDSGIGGLSVLRHLQAELPQESWLYLADQAHVPYGARPLPELRHFSQAITRFLLDQGATLIVLACNTASGAALTHLRATFPEVRFVGMEPALKPAALQTKSGKVGVLATSGTFESQRYLSLISRFGRDMTVVENPCPGLVEQIEAGETAAAETEQLIRRFLDPMLAQGVDTLVLGCTHYPFVSQLLEKIVGPEVTIIDPAPAVARQAARVVTQRKMADPLGDSSLRLFTTGHPDRFREQVYTLIGVTAPVIGLVWQNGRLRPI